MLEGWILSFCKVEFTNQSRTIDSILNFTRKIRFIPRRSRPFFTRIKFVNEAKSVRSVFQVSSRFVMSIYAWSSFRCSFFWKSHFVQWEVSLDDCVATRLGNRAIMLPFVHLYLRTCSLMRVQHNGLVWYSSVICTDFTRRCRLFVLLCLLSFRKSIYFIRVTTVVQFRNKPQFVHPLGNLTRSRILELKL